MNLDRKFPSFTLSAEQCDGLNEMSKKIIHPYSKEDYSLFVESCTKAVSALPEPLKQWAATVKKFGFGVLKNLPCDVELPATPMRKFELDHKYFDSDGIVGIISSLFGTLFTYEGKACDRHIHNVYPTHADADSQLGYSQLELEWHVEDGFHHRRPNWVLLSCLRGDTNVSTRIARSIDILACEDLPNIVFEKRFKLRVDDSFTTDNHDQYFDTPIIVKNDSNSEIIFDPFYTVTTNEQEAQALNFVKSCANNVKFEIALEKGDLLVFNNRTVIHARNRYVAKMDGSDRWVKRALIMDTAYADKLINGYLNLN